MAIYDNRLENRNMSVSVTKDELENKLQLLGKRIKYFRSIKKMTQEDLADEADINVSYLAKIENGYINTSVRYLIRLSKGLGIKAKDLIDF